VLLLAAATLSAPSLAAPPQRADEANLASQSKSRGWRSLAEIRREAREAGYKAVRKKFDSGEVVGSRSHMTYPMKNGRIWDREHGLLPPKDSDGYGAPRALDSAERVQWLKERLLLTRDGRRALELQRQYGVKVVFHEGKGASYNKHTNTISIGDEKPLRFL